MQDVEHRLEEGGDAAEHLQGFLKIYNAVQVHSVSNENEFLMFTTMK